MGVHKHAVVTGVSSGIGRATALLLAEHGFHVFGTVRHQKDGPIPPASARGTITPLVSDVTVPEQVAAATAVVRDHVGDAGLDVLVNNAGQGYFQPLEFLPAGRFRHHLAVNTEGPLQVTQALLPALRARAGRIVFIGSVSARFVTPFGGAHAATKSALAALANGLRQELAPWNIAVSLIEPATVRTAAYDRMETQIDSVLAEIGPHGRALYGDAFRRMMTRSVATGRKGSPPEAVAATVLRAATAAHPRRRYLVGLNARLSAALAMLPTGAVDATLRRVFDQPNPGSMAPQPSTRAAGAAARPPARKPNECA
jgi:NAD(P)-dependent dehydrogenase (short-subunit alcohol dehydrogenase family)